MVLNEYTFNNMINDLNKLKIIINELYKFDEFKFKLSFENHYGENKDGFLIRFIVYNETNFDNNGRLNLYHKLYNSSEIDLSVEEIVLNFFNIQKDLNKIFNFTYEIKDGRKND